MLRCRVLAHFPITAPSGTAERNADTVCKPSLRRHSHTRIHPSDWCTHLPDSTRPGDATSPRQPLELRGSCWERPAAGQRPFFSRGARTVLVNCPTRARRRARWAPNGARWRVHRLPSVATSDDWIRPPSYHSLAQRPWRGSSHACGAPGACQRGCAPVRRACTANPRRAHREPAILRRAAVAHCRARVRGQ